MNFLFNCFFILWMNINYNWCKEIQEKTGIILNLETEPQIYIFRIKCFSGADRSDFSSASLLKEEDIKLLEAKLSEIYTGIVNSNTNKDFQCEVVEKRNTNAEKGRKRELYTLFSTCFYLNNEILDYNIFNAVLRFKNLEDCLSRKDNILMEYKLLTGEEILYCSEIYCERSGISEYPVESKLFIIYSPCIYEKQSSDFNAVLRFENLNECQKLLTTITRSYMTTMNKINKINGCNKFQCLELI